VKTRATNGWLESLEDVLDHVLEDESPQRTTAFLEGLTQRLCAAGVEVPRVVNTPYVNTIPRSEQPAYPGDRAIEWRINSCVRWNAMAMVVNANEHHGGIGGHISTYASLVTLYEVGFNHFFRGPDGEEPADMIYFQGHATPGNYARAFLEGRLTTEHLEKFRRELAGGVSSYPHPYLMPEFWQFPTVSMGLGPIQSIYQARFNRYLVARGFLKKEAEPRVWAFVGDGEMDEPEAVAGLTLATRERLDNLTWVVNCNLQRLDGPVRGNGKIIQELEALFRGAGWNVIKVIWGSDWDPLLEADKDGLLVERMEQAVDGDYQKYSVAPGSYIRGHFFGTDPRLLELVNHLTDDQLRKLTRGGHDPVKVYAAYKAAVEHKGAPTVVLAKTIKGYGLGEAGEGRNVTHQQKKLNEKELREFRNRFGIPISDEEIVDAPFYRLPPESPEMVYLHERRKARGGFLPGRRVKAESLEAPPPDFYAELFGKSASEVSTTMAFVRLLSMLLRNKKIGSRVVPIIPDEARTFGMDSLFRNIGIYSSLGQQYEPVDRETLLYYKESKDGQILEEGITEAGSMCSFIAAGTSYASHGIPMIPFYMFYSMFGFQRIGDLMWAAGDMKARGFLLGATAGRTTLNGEGLQHQDGHSHVLASTYPTLLAYDPSFAYEIAVIVADGLRRMFVESENIFYYLTLHNENYPMPAKPEGVDQGILKGLYKFRAGPEGMRHKAHILGSGALLREALRAQEILGDRYDVSADVWSATSYKLLRTDALRCARWNMLHPAAQPRRSYIEQILEHERGVFIAVSDFMKLVPDQIAPWVSGGLTTLGTDGFGRSDTRAALRRFFEIDAAITVTATLHALARRGQVDGEFVAKAISELGVDPEKVCPEIV
jgi:pyruvate dehydrogenase E1 component